MGTGATADTGIAVATREFGKIVGDLMLGDITDGEARIRIAALRAGFSEMEWLRVKVAWAGANQRSGGK